MAEETVATPVNGKLKVMTWRSRRRMAAAALIWMIIETLLLFFVVPESKIAVLSEPITWSYFVMGGVITAYMGFKAFGKEKMGGS
jgi:hypothetical protein